MPIRCPFNIHYRQAIGLFKSRDIIQPRLHKVKSRAVGGHRQGSKQGADNLERSRSVPSLLAYGQEGFTRETIHKGGADDAEVERLCFCRRLQKRTYDAERADKRRGQNTESCTPLACERFSPSHNPFSTKLPSSQVRQTVNQWKFQLESESA